jgi:cation:H+ antiporter
MIYWIGFIICTSLIVYSGSRLAKYSDIIAEKTGLGRTWIGLALLATVTSLPELMTGISSVTYANVPDIAAGDVLGSCVFNMLILAVLDAFYRPLPISSKAAQGNIIAAGFGILLLSIATVSLFMGKNIHPIGWIGPYTLLIMIIYLLAVRLVFFYEKRRISFFVKERAIELKYGDITLKYALVRYCLNALIVIIAAIFLPIIGEGIAQITGLGKTFVGNVFIALATSLPEVVVSLSAVRMDAVDLAIGNLFGSNIFNLFILAIDDLFFLHGPLLSSVESLHIVSALSAISMITIAIIGLTYRAAKKPLLLSWDSIAIIFVFIVNLLLLYTLR